MSDKGAILLVRGWFDHPFFAEEPFTEREAWHWLILEAAWKPRRKRVGRTIFDLQRGQLAASVRFLAQAWRWHPRKTERFLNRLKSGEMIGTLGGTDATLITICNYDKYQLSPSESGEPNGEPNGEPAGSWRDKLELQKQLLKKEQIQKEGESERAREKIIPRKRVLTKTSLFLENPDFERFWEQYPKKTDRGTARKIFDRIVSDGLATADDLLSGAMRYSAVRMGEETRYTKSAANWLEGECWRDEPVPKNRPKLANNSAIEGIMSYFDERNGK